MMPQVLFPANLPWALTRPSKNVLLYAPIPSSWPNQIEQMPRPELPWDNRAAGRKWLGIPAGHVVIGAQVTFQRLELLAVEQADDVIRPNGFVWWNDRFGFGRFSHAYRSTPERLVNGGDESR